MKQIKTIITVLFISVIAFNCKTDKKQLPVETAKEPKIGIEQTEAKTNNHDNMIKAAIDEALKKSTRVNIDSITKDLILIKEHSFYKISPGDSIVSHKKKLKKEELKNGEGDFNVYTLYGEKNSKLAIIHPDPVKKGLIRSIEIISREAKTEDGISIGMTFGDLIKKYPEIVVHGSEIEGRTYANHGNISYLLNVYFNTYKVEKSKIKRTATIKSITIK